MSFPSAAESVAWEAAYPTLEPEGPKGDGTDVAQPIGMTYRDAEFYIRLQRRRERVEERAANGRPIVDEPPAVTPQPRAWATAPEFIEVATPTSPVAVP